MSLRRSWGMSCAVGGGLATLLVALVPSRSPGNPAPWYDAGLSDAPRYVAMASGEGAPYPWGGRWLVPAVARLLPAEAGTALRLINTVTLVAALVVLTHLASRVAHGRAPAMVASWALAATGAAVPLLAQNPYLVDGAALLAMGLIGECYLSRRWTALMAVIVVGTTVKETIVAFVLLLIVERKPARAAATAAACVGLLVFGWFIARPGSAMLLRPALGTVVKLYVGLGAAWIVVSAIIIVLLYRYGFRRLDSPMARFAGVTTVIVVVSIPLATDSTRLLLFALPAVIPTLAHGLRNVRLQEALVIAILCLPAALSVIPTRVVFGLVPAAIPDLEAWYFANPIVIGTGALIAALGAVYAMRHVVLGHPAPAAR